MAGRARGPWPLKFFQNCWIFEDLLLVKIEVLNFISKSLDFIMVEKA